MKKYIFLLLLLAASAAGALAQHSQEFRMVCPQPIENPDPEQGNLLGNKKKGYFNQTKDKGEFVLVIGYVFDDAYPFNEKYELARVKSADKYGYIRIDGVPVITCIYDDARDFDDQGYAMVNMDGKWGLLSHDNISAIPCVYDTMDDLFNGWYEVSRDGEWGYIHYTGVYASSMSEYQTKRETIGNDQN